MTKAIEHSPDDLYAQLGKPRVAPAATLAMSLESFAFA
jgi:hypothetical protein